MTSLVDKSLLQPRPGIAGGPRFGMLETLREYALDEATTHPDWPTVRRAHADHFLELAERAGPLLTSPHQAAWLDRLEAEHDNLRAALGWALEQGDGERLLRFGVALWWFWAIRGHWVEGRHWLERGLATGQAPPHLRASARHALGSLAFVQGDLDRSSVLAAEALAGQRAAGDRLGAGQTLLLLGRATQRSGQWDAARRHFAEALALFEALGDQRWTASALHNLGLAAYENGDYDQATALLQDSLVRWRGLGYAWGLATCIPAHLADIARAQGDDARAATLYRQSLVLNREQGDRSEIAGLLVGIAAMTAGRDAAAAGRLLGAASALRDALAGHLTSRERTDAERVAAEIRAALGEPTLVEAMMAGRTMPLPEAMAEAEAIVSGPIGVPWVPSARTSAPGADLSPREVDVLRLVVEGLTDKEIADRLAISRRTVSKHVETILGKLGVPSRTAAATYASRHGLL